MVNFSTRAMTIPLPHKNLLTSPPMGQGWLL
jgi:hypothetical protein